MYFAFKEVAGLCRPTCTQVHTHCNENPIYVFLFWELRGLRPNFHIHVSVRDLYIPRIGPHAYFLQQNRQIKTWEYINRSQTHECGNWDCGRAIPFLGIFVYNLRYLSYIHLGSSVCHPVCHPVILSSCHPGIVAER